MKNLMTLTSHIKLGSTGFCLEEFGAPYDNSKDAGVDLMLVSVSGGQPPIDPKSDLPENQTPAMTWFKADPEAQKDLAHSGVLKRARADDFDAVFCPGGHGPMWDLVDNPRSSTLISALDELGKPVAAVCDAPAVLHRVTHNGVPLVQGKRMTEFANSEEEAVQLTEVVPFLVEDELKRLDGKYEKAPKDWESFVLTDGHLITGQNPASSEAAARALLTLLASTHPRALGASAG